jgi:hypothetical protein
VANGTPTFELRKGMQTLREELRALKRTQCNDNARHERAADRAREDALLLKEEQAKGHPPAKTPQLDSEAARSDRQHRNATEGCDRRHSELMAMMATNASGHNSTFQNSMMLLATQHQQSMEQQRLALSSQQQQNTLFMASLATNK